jgi:hypothetical protein
MRIASAVLLTVFVAAAGATTGPAHADPYRWCGVYGGEAGSVNCYFITIEQCQAAISGMRGYCTANNFYDGRPVTTPEDGVRRTGKRRAS